MVSLSLMAYYTRHKHLFIYATAVVLASKLIVSPHTPWQAYIAVGFQGLCAYFFFGMFPYKVACILTAVITMLESALQRLLIMVLLYGNDIWVAIDKTLSPVLPASISPSFSIILCYVGIHFICGIIVGVWCIRLPESIKKVPLSFHNEMEEYLKSHNTVDTKTSKKISYKWFGIFFFLVIIGIFIYAEPSGALYKAIYLLIRALAVSMLFYFIISPFAKYLLQKKLSSLHFQEALRMIELFPVTAKRIQFCSGYVRKQFSFHLRPYRFIVLILSSMLYEHD
jgi:hypothetical protein